MDKTKKQAKEYDSKEFAPCDLKIILLGDSAVGKSNEERNMSTYALTMYRHVTNIDGKPYKIDIWDTAGQEQFQTLHASYYFQANACILVFDITRKITYLNLKKWYTEMKEHCPDIPCILIANKIDADRQVTSKQFKFASQYNLPFYFVSAADGTNVVKIFQEALQLALDNKLNPPNSIDKDIDDLLNDKDLFDDLDD